MHTTMVAALAIKLAVHTVKKKQNAPQRSHHHPGHNPWPRGSSSGTSRSSSTSSSSQSPLVLAKIFGSLKRGATCVSRSNPSATPNSGGVGGVRVPWLMLPRAPEVTRTRGVGNSVCPRVSRRLHEISKIIRDGYLSRIESAKSKSAEN